MKNSDFGVRPWRIFRFLAGGFLLVLVVSFWVSLAKSKGIHTSEKSEPPAQQVPPRLRGTESDATNFLAVMIEMEDEPAATIYAAALKDARADADAARSYALAHPKLKTSQALLKQKTSRVEISDAAAQRVKVVVQELDQAQQSILGQLTRDPIRAVILYRIQSAYNGIATLTSRDKIPAIAGLPGVKAVHRMVPKYRTAAFSDIDFLTTRSAWTAGPSGIHGEEISIGVIDTGLDYIHRNFGGSGSPDDYAVTSDTSSVPNANFPTAKIAGGYDFAGDAYNGGDPKSLPKPDPNPFDCHGHGTATVSLAAGYGVTSKGFTYSGNYDATQPDMKGLRISPGFAPHAQIYPLRVFGCFGSTNLVAQAIEWAMDPNGDGDLSDHLDVINMSLGASEGSADDPDSVASSNAALIGIQVVASAGNSGDSYFMTGAPSVASGVLSVAASFNDQGGFIYDSHVRSNTAGGGGLGTRYFSVYGVNSPRVAKGGLTGNVVYAVPANANAPALTNAKQINGNICLIDRGGTEFVDKITKAFQAGATGVIINNFTCTPSCLVAIQMFTLGQPNIPAVMISRSDRDAIVAASGGFDALTGVPANPVNVTINNDSGAQVVSGLAAPDTMPGYSSRGPRFPDSGIKPDLVAPAEVVGVAQAFSGNSVSTFNGTSSSAPHVAGIMALLRQLHPAWSSQELNGLLCATARQDLYTTPTQKLKYGVGRIGAGRVDVDAAVRSKVTAYNGTDSNEMGVSFGSFDTPVAATRTLSKEIKLVNKGASSVTYAIAYQDITPVDGASFTLPAGPITIDPGATVSVPVIFSATGDLLRHVRETSVEPTSGGNSRHWLTEKTGYAVFTSTSGPDPVLRLALYAAPRPVSLMHSTITSVVPAEPNVGTFHINLAGTPVNTGPNLGDGFDVLSLVKAFELQYVSQLAGIVNPPTSPNMIKHVGITSDYPNRGTNTGATRIVWGIEGFGDAPTPDYRGSDKEIFVDTGDGKGGLPDGEHDFIIYLSASGGANVFMPFVYNLHSGSAFSTNMFINGLSASVADTNTFNNSAVGIMLSAAWLAGPGYPAIGTEGHTLFQYQVITFDREGSQVDETPVLTYDLAGPGLEVVNSANLSGVAKIPSDGPFLEPFWYQDLPTNVIPVNYNGTNFQDNGSRGVLLLHMHNGSGLRADVITFRNPIVTGFSPASGHAGSQITITGSNFGAGTAVKFYDNQSAAINVITSNTLVAAVPAGAISGPIRVSNAAGATTAPGNFTVSP